MPKLRVFHAPDPRLAPDGTPLRRKHQWMPCILHDGFDELPPEEQTRLLKATYWADNITNAEWPVVLDDAEATAPNRSRLKRKAAGWIVALARIGHLNPTLYEAIVKQARTMYAEQVKQDFPWIDLVPGIAGLPQPDDGSSVQVAILTAEQINGTKTFRVPKDHFVFSFSPDAWDALTADEDEDGVRFARLRG